MRKLLIVDDSRFIRLAVRRIVESLGFAADEVENGQQALDYLQKSTPPDGILLDVMMPVMDGLTFLRAVRQDPRFRQLIIVVCTTRSAMEEIQAAVEAGANEYIMKPFTDEILADKLRQVGILA